MTVSNLANLDAISKILNHPTWDIVALLFLVAVGFFYGLSAGKTKLLAVLTSLYVSAFLFENISYIDSFVRGRNILETLLFRAAILAVIIFLLTVAFNKLLSRDSASGAKSWLSALLLSFLETGLLASLIFRLLPVKQVLVFSPLAQNLFASDNALIFWLTAPLIVLFFISRRK
jgi:hypothetical protein